MGRPRRSRPDLPECVYFKNGAYYFVSGNVWTRLGKTHHEAMAAWAKLIVPKEPGTTRTVADMLDKYALEVVPTKAPRTQKDNLQEMRFLRAFFGQMEVASVTPSTVAEYVEARKGKTRANREVALLSHAFNKAILWGWLPVNSNPCKLPGLRNSEVARDRYVEDSEVEAFKEYCSPWLKTYIDLKLLLGLRQQNMLALTHEENLRPDVLLVTILKRKRNEKTKRLKISRTPELDEVLARLKTKSGHFFQTTSGSPYASAGFGSIWRRAMAKFVSNGGQRFHEHDLRGKVATDIGDAKEAQALLGHKNISQTEDYIKSRKADVVQPHSRKRA